MGERVHVRGWVRQRREVSVRLCRHGKGRLTYQDGKEIKGVWEEGNLVNTENEKKQVDHEDQPLRRSVKANAFGYHPATSHRF